MRLLVGIAKTEEIFKYFAIGTAPLHILELMSSEKNVLTKIINQNDIKAFNIESRVLIKKI